MLNFKHEHFYLYGLYDEANWEINNLYHNKNNMKNMYDIANKVIHLIEDDKIKYRDLSIQGLNTQHFLNVSILNGLIGKFLAIEDLESLILGGMLHDIGKCYIPLSILNKRGPLNLKEKKLIDTHPSLGHSLMKGLTKNQIILEIVKNHHFSINNLNKEIDINTLNKGDLKTYSLISGISDITDAMLSFRSYKKPLPLESVIECLTEKGISNAADIIAYIY